MCIKQKIIWGLSLGLLVTAVSFVVGNNISEAFAENSVAVKSESNASFAPSKIILKGDEQTAVFAGGCFWGVEAVFENIKGVKNATSGYSGGAKNTADYESVGNGNTGHAEAVEVVFDPAQVSYEQLLKVFFAVAHDPTELNRQGPDEGTQYRSAIFYTDDTQKQSAKKYIAQLTAAKAYSSPIVTEVSPLKAFYPAEEYHQNFLVRHPNNGYIVTNDLPKIANLKKQFPELYSGK